MRLMRIRCVMSIVAIAQRGGTIAPRWVRDRSYPQVLHNVFHSAGLLPPVVNISAKAPTTADYPLENLPLSVHFAPLCAVSGVVRGCRALVGAPFSSISGPVSPFCGSRWARPPLGPWNALGGALNRRESLLCVWTRPGFRLGWHTGAVLGVDFGLAGGGRSGRVRWAHRMAIPGDLTLEVGDWEGVWVEWGWRSRWGRSVLGAAAGTRFSGRRGGRPRWQIRVAGEWLGARKGLPHVGSGFWRFSGEELRGRELESDHCGRWGGRGERSFRKGSGLGRESTGRAGAEGAIFLWFRLTHKGMWCKMRA